MDTAKTATDPLHVRVLVPDGGQLEEPEQDQEETEQEAREEDASAQEQEEEEVTEEETEDEATEDGEEEATEKEEEGEKEDERAEKIATEGTRLVHLNLDGLFLDLLGLEVDLDEVTLNLTASPGDGKLLGNLLSAVGGLLDGSGLGDLLSLGGGDSGDSDGSLLGGLMPSLPELNPVERARRLASALAGRLRELLGEVISALPLEELLTQFLEGLVDQLINGGNGSGDESTASA